MLALLLAVTGTPVAAFAADPRLDRLDALIAAWEHGAADSLLAALTSEAMGESPGDDARRLDLDLRRIRLARLRGTLAAADAADSLRAWRAERGVGSAEADAALFLELARSQVAAGDPLGARGVLEEGLARLGGASREEAEPHRGAAEPEEAARHQEAPPRGEAAPHDDVELHRAALLHELGSVALNLRDRDTARERLRGALEIRQRRLGADHHESARTRLLLAVLRFQDGDTLHLRSEYAAAVGAVRAALGPRHPDTLWALMLQASYLQATGEREDARVGYDTVLAGRRERGLPEDLQEAWILNNFGVLCQELERYAEAESLFQRAVDVRMRLLGPAPLTARSLTHRGNLLFLRGAYTDARRQFDDALAIFEKAGLEDDPDVGRCLLLLGMMHLWTEDLETADRFLERARRIGALHRRPGDEATALQGLGQSALARGRHGAGEEFFRRALRLLVESAGDASSRAAELRLDLGRALAAQGRWSEAEREFGAALAALADSPEPEEVRLGFAHYELGEAYLRQGRFSEAADELGRSMHRLEAALEPSHPQLVLCWLGLARASREIGRPGAAHVLALRAQRLQLELITRNLSGLTERHALLFGRLLDEASSLALEIVLESGSASEAQRVATWEAFAASRNLILREMTRRQALASRARPESERLARARDRLANLYLRETAATGDARLRSLLNEALAEREAAERALADATALEAASDLSGNHLNRGRRALPEGSVLVAFARTRESSVTVGAERPARYGAFVGGGTGPTVVVSLGPAGVVDEAIAEWMAEAGDASGRLRLDPAAAESACRRAGARLRDLLWDPLREAVGSSGTVFIVPAGAIGLVSFAALPADSGGFLLDEGRHFRYLNQEQDLESPGPAQDGGFLALGDVPCGDAAFATPPDGSVRRGSAECDALRERDFPPLPGTRDEVTEAAELWRRSVSGATPVDILLGADASEAAFRRRVGGHRVVHLATHGFFLEEECVAPSPGTPSAGDTPLLRSGLLLAPTPAIGSESAAQRDGVLTAEEVASLDLSGVDVAVLSACRSGVGRATASEGLFGLRRAFQVAGARSLVVSLWAVGDRVARDWIGLFYDELLVRRATPAAASEAAARRLLDARRGEKRSTHPFYWASFITVGDVGGTGSGAAPALH